MAEAKINESCIIGLPTCGYAFSSSRMAFIASPTDDEFRLELDILETLLRDKEYEGAMRGEGQAFVLTYCNSCRAIRDSVVTSRLAL